MTEMTATQAQRQFGALLDEASRGPVNITKQGRRTHVILGGEDYEEWASFRRAISVDDSPLMQSIRRFRSAVAASGDSDAEIRALIDQEIAAARVENRTR